MKKNILVLAILLPLMFHLDVQAQLDGDHPISDPGSGITYLAPDGNVNGGLTQPDGFTVGTLPNPAAALVVEGSQMTNPTGNVFQTDAPNSGTTTWRMLYGGGLVGSLFSGGTHFEMDAPAGDLRFNTAGINRMRIVNANGRVGIGTFGAIQPQTLLHVDNNATGLSFGGFRSWMNAGISATQASDMSYFGLRQEALANVSSTVVGWGDNAGQEGPDRLKFIFTSQLTVSPGHAGTQNGLETVRIVPDANGLESYFGIGEWLNQGSNADPNERLDLLNQTIRLRDFMHPTLVPERQS